MNNAVYTSSSVVQLFDRIRTSQLQDKQNECFNGLKSKCLYLFFIIFVLCFFECHNRIYNVWNGPFHLNLDEFIIHWKFYSGNVPRERSLLSGLISFDQEYLQIELGQDKIDEDPKHIYGIYYRHPTYKKLLYTFNPIKDQNITTLPMQLFVKLSTNLQPHFHQRLPYRFELFNSDTLTCIAQQIGISPEVYRPNSENPMPIQLIEDIYNRNATDFNNKVISKCGILLGYLYDCGTETVFSGYSDQPYKFTTSVAAFDASSSYSSYMTYLLSSLLLLGCSKIIFEMIFNLFQFLWYIFSRSRRIVSPDIQDTLRSISIDSIQLLDYLLMRTLKENNYHNQLFLIQDQHLIVFKINLNERDPTILCQFYTTTPFIIINIDRISEISSDYISISDGSYRNQIPVPKIGVKNSNDDTANWLHERLMHCTANYRYQYYEQERLRKQQAAVRFQEEQIRLRLAAFINEEEELQRADYENDFDRIVNRITSASPHFIAQFRLKGPQIVNIQLSKTITCAICLETLQPGETYSQWPCPAQHAFHYNCMLNVLRKQNQCPLCRHPVEAANVPPIETAFRMFFLEEDFPVTA